MTQEQERIKIAEACGWKITETDFKEWTLVSPTGSVRVFDGQYQCVLSLPDVFNCLNACHEMEKVMMDDEHTRYRAVLQAVSNPDRTAGWLEMSENQRRAFVSATAAQRAEAFGLALGLWKEGGMSEELQSRVERVKELCRMAIELGEKATEGPWERPSQLATHIISEHSRNFGHLVCDCPDSSPNTDHFDHDAAFIAHARTFSPDAARAVLVAVEGLEKAHTRLADSHDLDPKCSESGFTIMLAEICNQFKI